jgi:hypothetical protein
MNLSGASQGKHAVSESKERKGLTSHFKDTTITGHEFSAWWDNVPSLTSDASTGP